MSTRLTNDAREKIINAAMEKSGFPARLKDARYNVEKIKMECLIASFGGMKAYRRLCDRISTIRDKVDALDAEGIMINGPRGYSTWQCNKMNIGGMNVYYPCDTTLATFDEFKGLLILHLKGEKPTITTDNPLVQKFLDAEAVVNELDSSAKGIKQNVKAVVYSVNTTKRLVEVWPEAAELIPSDIEVVRASVPAVNFQSLNAAIGIPSQKK